MTTDEQDRLIVANRLLRDELAEARRAASELRIALTEALDAWGRFDGWESSELPTDRIAELRKLVQS